MSDYLPKIYIQDKILHKREKVCVFNITSSEKKDWIMISRSYFVKYTMSPKKMLKFRDLKSSKGRKNSTQFKPWILLAKNNGMLPPPCPMHKIFIGFLPQTALSRSNLQDAMVANPAETMLFTSVEKT